MAGETTKPASRRIAHLQPRPSGDDAYRSATPSAVNTQSLADSVIRKEAPPMRAVREFSDIPRSSDVYYRDPRASLVRRASQGPAARMDAAEGLPAAQPRNGSTAEQGRVRLGGLDDLRGAVEIVVTQLQRGIPRVVFEIADEPRDLIRRARALLETKVTREVITEDQFRDVAIVKVAASSFAIAPVGTPTAPLVAPAGEVAVAADDGLMLGTDPADFLAQEEETPEMFAAEAAPPPVVVNPDDDPDFLEPTKAEAEPDFLDATTPPPAAEEPAEAAAEEPAAEPQGGRRGRRHGRGAN